MKFSRSMQWGADIIENKFEMSTPNHETLFVTLGISTADRVKTIDVTGRNFVELFVDKEWPFHYADRRVKLTIGATVFQINNYFSISLDSDPVSTSWTLTNESLTDSLRIQIQVGSR